LFLICNLIKTAFYFLFHSVSKPADFEMNKAVYRRVVEELAFLFDGNPALCFPKYAVWYCFIPVVLAIRDCLREQYELSAWALVIRGRILTSGSCDENRANLQMVRLVRVTHTVAGRALLSQTCLWICFCRHGS
jgi:hypothetical protein